MSTSQHYYDREGNSVHEVPAKKGGMRATTIKDARELKLYPSVTTVQSILAKPQLDAWKMDKVAEAGRVLMQPDDESDEDYRKRVIAHAFEEVSDAADLGTNIHKALEQHFKGEPYDSTLQPYVSAVDEWANKNGVKFLEHELRLVNSGRGYAGTTDAVIEHNGRKGILDFKSRKTTPGKPCTPYDGQAMQIAAYYFAKFGGITNGMGVNVWISTTEPGRVEATWYDAEALKEEWSAFEHVLALWRFIKGYDPR